MLTLAQNVRVLENFGTQWSNETRLHPLALSATILCAIWVLACRRERALWPFIFLACLVPSAQRLVVLTLDFNLIRLLVLAAAARIVMRNEHMGVRWHAMDGVVVAFALVRTVAYTVQQGTFGALVFQSGQVFDSVGMYFAFRCLVRNRDDVLSIITVLAAFALPVAMFFMIEKSTGRNMFSVFGGVPEITRVREDRLRCQGPFPHAIIAGCFWAGLVPLFGALLWQPGHMRRLLGVAAVGAGLAIVVFCASSTPVAGVMFGAIGAAFFFLRRRMGWVVMAACVALVGLHLSMKAPVWHLISRVSLARGSTSYFRYQLIDNAINRFGEWAAVGTTSTAHWFWGAQDLTNHYILEGVRGGALSLLLFVVIIGMSFRTVGRAWRAAEGDLPGVVLAWAIGVGLFVHCGNFLGVSYFGQIVFLWFLHLAIMGSMQEQLLRQATSAATADRHAEFGWPAAEAAT